MFHSILAGMIFTQTVNENGEDSLSIIGVMLIYHPKRSPYINEPRHEKIGCRSTYRQWISSSACVWVQSDQGIWYPLTESLDTVDYIDVQQRPLSDCVASLADLDPQFPLRRLISSWCSSNFLFGASYLRLSVVPGICSVQRTKAMWVYVNPISPSGRKYKDTIRNIWKIAVCLLVHSFG